jgi:hypothetical protein
MQTFEDYFVMYLYQFDLVNVSIDFPCCCIFIPTQYLLVSSRSTYFSINHGIICIFQLNIMHYLEETRPSRPLMPQDVHKRAKVHITFLSLSFTLM